MVATMYAAPGVGLAAPQIGVNVRLIVIDTSVGEKDGELIVMANPQILESDGRQSEEEGCLSVPGYSGVTRRPAWVKVRGQRLDGATFEMEGSGLLARAFAHEVDHLDGRLFLDRLGVLKRDLIVRKLRRRIRRGRLVAPGGCRDAGPVRRPPGATPTGGIPTAPRADTAAAPVRRTTRAGPQGPAGVSAESPRVARRPAGARAGALAAGI